MKMKEERSADPAVKLNKAIFSHYIRRLLFTKEISLDPE